MSVTATQLSKSGARGKELDRMVQEQIQIIDDRLLKADRTWGRNVVEYSLPVDLSIPGLAKKDAQRILYTNILQSLEKRGFDTGIILEDNSSILLIAWMTDLESKEIDAMNAIIRSKRLTTADAISRFIQQSGKYKTPRVETAAGGMPVFNAEETLLSI